MPSFKLELCKDCAAALQQINDEQGSDAMAKAIASVLCVACRKKLPDDFPPLFTTEPLSCKAAKDKSWKGIGGERCGEPAVQTRFGPMCAQCLKEFQEDTKAGRNLLGLILEAESKKKEGGRS